MFKNYIFQIALLLLLAFPFAQSISFTITRNMTMELYTLLTLRKMSEKQKKNLGKTLNLYIDKVSPNITNSNSEYWKKKYWDDKETDPL